MIHSLTLMALALLSTLGDARPLMRRDMRYVTEIEVVRETAIVYQTTWVYRDAASATAAPRVKQQGHTASAAFAAPTTSAPMPASKPKYTSTHFILSTSTYTPQAGPSSTVPDLMASSPVSTSSYSSGAAPTISTAAEPTSAPATSPDHDSSTTFTGDMTHYAVGLGSCGWTSTPNENVVAIPHDQMNNGANPNSNPLCGKMVNISYGGKTTQAKVVDTCMGCANGALDMSDGLFSFFAPLGLGRLHGMTWSFAN